MIRKAKPSEIQQIIEMTKACAKKMIAEGIFQWNEHYPNIEAFIEDEKRGELFVMLAEDAIVGSIAISTKKDEEYEDVAWLTEDGKNLYIHRLAVHPNFQHQGNAKALMDFAETFAEENEATSIRLDTFSQNKRNVKFYESRGYKRLANIYFPKQSEHPFHCYELVLQSPKQ